jgi:hypothetical protein
MLEEPNFIPNSDPFDKYIFPEAPETGSEILPVQSNGGKEQKSDLSYPPTKIKSLQQRV